jgi:hypothetical protein
MANQRVRNKTTDKYESAPSACVMCASNQPSLVVAIMLYVINHRHINILIPFVTEGLRFIFCELTAVIKCLERVQQFNFQLVCIIPPSVAIFRVTFVKFLVSIREADTVLVLRLLLVLHGFLDVV